jgi:hypothetical protein
MATQDEIINIFDELQTAFSNFKPDNPSKMIDVYLKFLTPYSLDALNHAASEYIKTGKYFPSVSEIVQRAETWKPPEVIITNTHPQMAELIRLKRAALAGNYNRDEWLELVDVFKKLGFESTADHVRDTAGEYAPVAIMQECEHD